MIARRINPSAIAAKGDGAILRISVGLDADTHRRLCALTLLRGLPASDLMAGLIATAVACVQLPTEMGDSTENAA